MKFNKKGQAALEFLTTYGWAFLVILIMIAALAYFGVLSPAKLLPERCNFAAEFACDEFLITTVSATDIDLDLAMTNNVGKAVTIISANITDTPGVTGYTCNLPVPATIGAGGKFTFDCNPITAAAWPPAGEKQRIGIELEYLEVGGNFNHKVKGEVVGNIQ